MSDEAVLAIARPIAAAIFDKRQGERSSLETRVNDAITQELQQLEQEIEPLGKSLASAGAYHRRPSSTIYRGPYDPRHSAANLPSNRSLCAGATASGRPSTGEGLGPSSSVVL
ncbi:MAG: hypothetical protein HC857_13245 [Synechococcales cyanobacterium RU_4_20]|nr:hypothetical protein [Synechococcales cyanobacterium RU_4_20]